MGKPKLLNAKSKKMKRYIAIAILTVTITIAGCKKDFLNKTPLDQLTEATAFQTADNFKTYAWSLYEIFEGYGRGAYGLDFSTLASETYSDNMAYSSAGSESGYAFQKIVAPATGGAWNFGFIRRVNIMLDNIDKSVMAQADKDHWKSVGYFFRAYRYFELLAAFGDVPWLEHVVSDADKEILYGKRTPRDQVAANILDNLVWAQSHIRTAGDGPNTINANVVRALISRFGLFEGTWRKYHGLANADNYLRASATASQALITAFPNIMSSYDDLFNSEDLSGKPGIILFKQYAANEVMHSLTRVTRTSSWFFDVAKDAVQSYLCTDGRPISTSPLYAGDHSMYDEFRNRDRRLYFTVVPPYKVVVTPPVGNSFSWTYTNNPADREYIDLMASLPGNLTDGKRLPVTNWNGFITNMSPHFRKFNGGQGFDASELGYYYYKQYNMRTDVSSIPRSTTDCPIFRIEEVMLNYAEAKFELGEFDQGIADLTINKLRSRAGVSAMNVSAIDASFDSNRDVTVDPLLWEIRRERRVELMGDGFRFNDLKRWKKGNYINKQQLGVWVKNADFGNKLKIMGGGAEGYVQFFDVPLGWLDKYYLEPVPLNEIALNPALEQNPGW
jgi:hypothetical protein